MKKAVVFVFVNVCLLLTLAAPQVHGWSCPGHTSIVQEGSSNSDACVTDNRHSFKHYVNNEKDKTITVEDFSNGDPTKGDLYKKIYDLSEKVYDNKPLSKTEKEDLVHSLGDLSNPMHNVIYEGYNKEHHGEYDKISLSKSCVEAKSIDTIQTHKQFIEAAVILANEAKKAGYVDIDANNMNFTRNNACKLASQSATLISAVVKRMG